MMQPSDKELDKMIREAAEQFDNAGATPNWEGMRVLLEEEIPAKKEPRRKPFLLMVLLVILLLGSFLYFNYNKTGGNTKTGNLIHVKKKAAGDTNKTNTSSGDVNTSHEVAVQNHATDVPRSIASPRHVIKNDHLKNIKTGYSAINTSAGEAGDHKNILPASGVEATEPKDTKTGSFTEPVLINEPSLSNQAANGVQKKGDKVPFEIVNTEKIKSVDTVGSDSTKKSKQINNKKHPLEISLVYAPELTTIKLSHFDKPGSNYGVLIGYEILKNISLQTGVVVSRKNYTAKGADFKSNYPVTPPFKLTRVDGFCNMYEIPLNIKYKLSRGKKISTTVMAGISSFFMTKESYNYLYSSTSMGSYRWSNEYHSQKNYWLSNAMIGIGFEKEISKSINIGAAPFAKIPLKGMGTGDLKLLSAGVNFSLSYKPAFNKFHK